MAEEVKTVYPQARSTSPEDFVITVDKVDQAGDELVITASCNNLSALIENGRSFVQEYIRKKPELSMWNRAGIEKASGTMPFDPASPEKDVEDRVLASKMKMRYRQQ